jgi:hypothetical protein
MSCGEYTHVRPRPFLIVLLAAFLAGGCTNGADHDSERAAGPCDERIEELRHQMQVDASVIKVFVASGHEDELQELAERLRGIEGVQHARTITKDQALANAKELFKDSPDVMENLPGNPFPAAIELTVDPDRATEIASAGERLDSVDDVGVGGEKARRLQLRLLDQYRTGDQQVVCAALDGFQDAP